MENRNNLKRIKKPFTHSNPHTHIEKRNKKPLDVEKQIRKDKQNQTTVKFIANLICVNNVLSTLSL